MNVADQGGGIPRGTWGLCVLLKMGLAFAIWARLLAGTSPNWPWRTVSEKYIWFLFFSNPTIFNDICLNLPCFLVRKAAQIVAGRLFDVYISEEYDSSR